VLASLGIRHVGGTAARALARPFGDIDSLLNADEEAIAEVDEIGPITADSVYRFLQSDAGQHVIDDLKDAGVDLTEPQAESASETAEASPFAGKTIVLTGTLENFKRNELKEKLQSLGANVTGMDIVLEGGAGDIGAALEPVTVEQGVGGTFVARADGDVHCEQTLAKEAYPKTYLTKCCTMDSNIAASLCCLSRGRSG